MIFTPNTLRVDRSAYPVIESPAPFFSWGASHERPGASQTACRITVERYTDTVWDSGWVETPRQSMPYGGPALCENSAYRWTLRLRDDAGVESASAEGRFVTALTGPWTAPWIAAEDRPGRAPYFRREFTARVDVVRAVLYVCGVGYQLVTLNGERVDDAVLQPVVSDYSKTCYYTVLDVTDWLVPGDNCLGVVLGEGWRRNEGAFLNGAIGERTIPFYGRPQLTAQLRILYDDGSQETLVTDGQWECGFGGYVHNHLFDGETYDERLEPYGFDCPGYSGDFAPAVVVDGPGGVLRPQTVEPIRVQEAYAPAAVYCLEPGRWLVDFGQNLAGRVRLLLPASLRTGDRVTLRFAEELDGRGELDTANLRGAKCTDTFLSDGCGEAVDWAPEFTYHGFRYATVEGLPEPPSADNCVAEAFYTDIDSGSWFRCGSAAVNALHELAVMTERANLHGIATDCPQRDERMGWMNDATVRFEETPYNFHIGRLFPKLVQDIIDSQSDDGAMTCTAPFIYGGRPADPVCSSFLIAAAETLLHTGDPAAVAAGYEAFDAWNRFLAAHSTAGIVDYTYYGDWAGPADCCLSMEDPHSSLTDGILMSTGYHYYNYTLLARFAETLGKPEDAARYTAEAERVRAAMLQKWYHPDTAAMDTGSQGCQAFALWLGILPARDRPRAAALLHQAVVDAGMRLTTGNLCTRYLMDMLSDYGYADDVLTLLERQEYPSWGYMLQNAATTVWERFELKENGGMNSHCHPMYGAVDYWLYNRLAGIQPAAPGWERVRIAPVFPVGLLYAEASVSTCRGDVYVRWHKKYGKTSVAVSLPFGTTGELCLPDGTRPLASGFQIVTF